LLFAFFGFVRGSLFPTSFNRQLKSLGIQLKLLEVELKLLEV
jgi:hypothetical protein